MTAPTSPAVLATAANSNHPTSNHQSNLETLSSNHASFTTSPHQTRKRRALPHIPIAIGAKAAHKLPVLAVWDNCCSDGLMSLALLQRLQATTTIGFTPSPPGESPSISAAFAGAATAPIGIAEFHIQFKDSKADVSFEFPYKAFVVRNLGHPFFMGNDLILSTGFRQGETNKEVTLKHPEDQLAISIDFEYLSGPASVNLVATERMRIPPGTSRVCWTRPISPDTNEPTNLHGATWESDMNTEIFPNPRLLQLGSHAPCRIHNNGVHDLNIRQGQICASTNISLPPITPARTQQALSPYKHYTSDGEPVNLVHNVVKFEHLPMAEADELRNTCMDYQDIFSVNDLDLGLIDFYEHTIPLSAPLPRADKQRVLPRSKQQPAADLIGRLAKGAIIEPCFSNFAMNANVVPKPNGKWRFVLDARKLNDVTEDQKITIGIPESLLEKLAHTKYRSAIDMASGYHQVALAKNDRYKTAFYSPTDTKKLFQYCRMSMGLKTASTSFTHVMEIILEGLNFCIFYLDDVIVFSDTWEEHMEHIRIIFDRFRKANMKLDPKKCKFCSADIKFLGFQLHEDSISVPELKVKALREMPTPTSKKALLSALAAMNYYRKFIRGFR